MDAAKCSQNIDNTGSTEKENSSKTFVRPEWRGKKAKDKSRVSGDLQDGGGLRRGDHLPPHKYFRNTSTRGTTPTEHLLNAGRKPDFPKGKKLPMYMSRAKEKTDKRIGMGPAPLGGSCEGGKVSTH